ncbi:7367_t:CDS:2 [Scutellospora calospora]|uniref:7367_t:CDS:1 n=1 Tax=Scutellospora calospora TaxID=85575 RepID=A0ACA9JTV1_9GLOM|nr:7367_t:CDS:2 [Scutellospora calospora]
MPRHSKNNTALSFFTYAEGKALKYGTKKQRLGRDSMREFDACFLCLRRARDPICCEQGHLYCKECILENLLAQKKEIRRQQNLLEARAKDELEESKRKEQLAKEAVIHNFERQQVRIAPFGSKTDESTKLSIDTLTKTIDKTIDTPNSSKSVKAIESSEAFQDKELTLIAGKKRDFHLDEDEAAATKPKLPNFWLPSLTPSADPDKIKSVKLQTMCTATDPEHPFGVKNFIPTKFTEDIDTKTKKTSFVCPSCRKTLTNSVKICLMKRCGHVICKTCVEKFVKSSKQCFVCNEKCRSKDITDMSGEGTGFASGGGPVMAERFDVAFQ